jgi:glycosyltransferase involved in cell wall biosynthesis
MVSKAFVVGTAQRKAEEIARLGVELTVLAPPSWQDRRGAQIARPVYTQGYLFKIIPVRCNGNYHFHYYPTLASELVQLRPQLVHIDEEPYNLATWLALGAVQRIGSIGTFFTWQNLYRVYPPPFRWFEQANYRRTPLAIAGNQEAVSVLRLKGYQGEVAVVRQFGVDPAVFTPPLEAGAASCLRIGYAGGLLREKGVDLLIKACAGLRGRWQLRIVGEGSERGTLERLVAKLALSEHVRITGRLESTQMAQFYRELDVFVLPSRTTPTWKEQFGRVLIEAMACGVTVIGSECGEIPNVIGDAGLLFPENDVAALRNQLQRLLDDPQKRVALGAAGRQRVLNQFTMATVAEQTVAVYRQLLAIAGNKSLTG